MITEKKIWKKSKRNGFYHFFIYYDLNFSISYSITGIESYNCITYLIYLFIR